ncbi:WD domain, G-beta repeat [Gemmata sp. SH-PL17]|uniref:FecR domain-containing protein n=1 Tax=Gemmata sp. SH-PL17 TaxID=1630693 RepID=UPI00078B9A90|nr:FecR domain-containing protein [Gemmata sp. SH-PL17]AMV26355.1 WD domain, G-beta repeat [Gemmata sp. SH-PL17]
MTRIAELTLRLLDHALTDAEDAELDALIATDPEAEAEHLALLELEAELRGLRTGFDLSDVTLAMVRDAQTERTTDAVMAEIADLAPPTWAARVEPVVVASTEPHVRRRLWAGVVALATCAAVVAFAVWVVSKPAEIVQPKPDEPALETRAFAKLSRKEGIVEVLDPAGDAILAEEGADLPAGFTLRTVGDDSHAVVDLISDQSRFEIEPDSVVRFRDGTPENATKPQLFLAAGQLTAAITPQANRPMVVGTPVAEVSTRSGLFVVSSAGPDSARVDIKKGKVELVRAAAPKPVPVGVGSALVNAGFDKVHIEKSWNVDRSPKKTFAVPGHRDVIFSPDGSEIWAANGRMFTRWTETGPVELSFYAKKLEGAAAFTRNKRLLVAFRGEKDDRVLVRTLPDGGEHAAINVRPNEARLWTAAPDASWLALVEPRPSKRLRVFDGATGDERFARDFDENVGGIAASPDARVLAVGLIEPGRSANNKVALLDATTGERFAALATPKKPITALAYSDDGWLLAVGFNGIIQLWDVRNRELLRSITGFERALTCLAFSPNGKRLAAGTPDGHVWLWNTETAQQTQLIETGGRGVRSIAFHPTGKELITVAPGTPVAVWDVNETFPGSHAIQ